MPFLVIPILMIWLSRHVADAADGVVELTEEPALLFDVRIQAAPGSPYGEHNQ